MSGERDIAPNIGVIGRSRRRALAVGIFAGLAASVAALGLAPSLMPGSYSWVAHTTSQSAAQGVDGAWLARLGFVLFGLSVLRLAGLAAARWGGWGAALHAAFGALMVATAAFSTRSWVDGAAFDATEDLLHSVTATAMGFAFALGILAVLLRRLGRELPARVFDVVAIASSVILPLGMTVWTGHAGLLQRVMFGIAYVWYAVETARAMTGRDG